MNVAAATAADTAQTSGEMPQTAIAGDGQTAKVNDATFESTNADGVGTPTENGDGGAAREESRTPQGKETNAEFARRRREEERRRELAQTRNNAIIAPSKQSKAL